ncbi:hypothetical protein Tco_1005364 [Tanacetum coccineum]|uniref:Uncharacterized protein n=1 Tax=Tanacetum coccineum TaxID=301880 RepID=A0ABQ5FF72_9ASTR
MWRVDLGRTVGEPFRLEFTSTAFGGRRAGCGDVMSPTGRTPMVGCTNPGGGQEDAIWAVGLSLVRCLWCLFYHTTAGSAQGRRTAASGGESWESTTWVGGVGRDRGGMVTTVLPEGPLIWAIWDELHRGKCHRRPWSSFWVKRRHGSLGGGEVGPGGAWGVVVVDGGELEQDGTRCRGFRRLEG